MASIDTALVSIGALNELASQDTHIHRLDPRAKLITTVLFIVTVVSFDKYAVSALLPLVLYPVVLTALGDIPTGAIIRKVLIVSPFAVLIGIFNPFFDREVLMHIGGVPVTGGVISFASILLRFFLTVGVALLLIAVTGFEAVCQALERLKVPRAFVVQLLFLYRYLFVLLEEGLRIRRAYALRAGDTRGVAMRHYGSLSGQLLLRTLDRAQRIHQAMLCRGFDGRIRVARSLRAGPADILFVIFWCLFFLLARRYNLPLLLGAFVEGVVS